MGLLDKVKGIFRHPISESVSIDEPGYSLLNNDLSFDYIREIREEAWNAFLTNPIAKRQVRNITSYLVGRGLKVFSPSPDAQEIIDNFIYNPKNYWELFIREESNRLQLDGEIIVMLYVNTGDGSVIVRDIEPNEIVDVILSPEDYREVLALRRVYTKKVYSNDFKTYHTEQIEDIIRPGEPDPNNPNIVRDFLFIKMPTISTQFRGIPELASQLYWLKQYRQLLDARINLNKMRSNYIWDVTVDGNDADVQAVRNANSKPPKAGTVKFHNSKVKWEPKSLNINAQEAEADLRAVKLMCVAGSGQPEFMVTGDASNANFASTQETTLSFLKCLEDYQDLFEYFLGALFNKVFHYAQKYGSAPQVFLDSNGEEVRGDALISLSFPESKPKDIDKLGKYLQTLQDMGLASHETLASMAGLNWKAEKAKMEER